MALSKTHLIAFFIACYQKDTTCGFNRIPYVILPDAIRCYGIPRTSTHFELQPVTGIASSFRFPNIEEFAGINEETVMNRIIHSESEYNQIAVGDATSIAEFIATNADIDQDVFQGCLIHLIQDSCYDEYIRQVIDMSQRRKTGQFLYGGEVYDAKSVRTLITEIEEQEFCYLRNWFREISGIDADQNFFDTIVRKYLEEVYPEKMLETTMKYIKISDQEPKQVMEDSKVAGICHKLVECTIPLV